MASTYEPIASTVIGSNSANYQFTSIPSTYTDLRCVIRSQTSHSSPSSLRLRFNGDTGTNYSLTRLWGTGSAAVSGRFSNDTSFDIGFMPDSTSGIGTMIFDVMSYGNTNVFTTLLGAWESQAGPASNQFVLRQVGLWRNTNAITTMTFSYDSGNIVAGSTFSLYGIKAA